jgi:hypothetical protein
MISDAPLIIEITSGGKKFRPLEITGSSSFASGSLLYRSEGSSAPADADCRFIGDCAAAAPLDARAGVIGSELRATLAG